MDETCKQLRKKYKNYYLAKGTLPSHFDLWSCHASVGIDDVPKAAFPELMKTFKRYTDRLLTVKRHKHRWRLSRSDEEYVWMLCADCDADQQLALTEHLPIIHRLVLSKRDDFTFETEEEEHIIKQFFKDHPETLQKSKEKLVKRQEKLLEQNPKSPEVSKLEREIEKIHLFALICKE